MSLRTEEARDARRLLDELEERTEALRALVLADSDGSDDEVRALARRFVRLNDDWQAKVFVEIARLAAEWGPGKLESQAFFVGRHLKRCECSTEDAREFVRSLASGLA